MSSQYFVGDESNQAPQLPGYTVVNLHASYQINKTYQIYGRVDNVFNNHYATYATFFDTTALPNFNTGNRLHQSGFAQPGAAVRLCRPEGDVLRQSPVTPCACR